MESIADRAQKHLAEIALIRSAAAALEWDERTHMPAKGGAHRAEQVGWLAGEVHRKYLESWFVDAIELLAADAKAREDDPTGTTWREALRQVDRMRRVPEKLVIELTRASVTGQQAWIEARANDDFKCFSPHLQKLLELRLQQANALGFDETAYDALLDEFEPGMRSSEVTAVFDALKVELLPFVAEILASRRRPDASILTGRFSIAEQERFARRMAEAIGFDFSRGRLDASVHPFCTALGPHDHRLTTRYDEHAFGVAFFGVMHEAGHGLYEQGLDPAHYACPRGEAVSLGIHESQSRLWENAVGRSRGFWQYALPIACEYFPHCLADVNLDDFYFAVNDVRASQIRVEADEVTYNLHVMIRFELEQALVSGDLPVEDLPSAWNRRYEEYLGITPSSDADGVLQDIHWSAGMIGYFPTYTLGNLYAAHFIEAAERSIGPLEPGFAAGDFAPLLSWLRRKIHAHGQRFHARELLDHVTGESLSPDPLMRQLRAKFAPLYLE